MIQNYFNNQDDDFSKEKFPLPRYTMTKTYRTVGDDIEEFYQRIKSVNAQNGVTWRKFRRCCSCDAFNECHPVTTFHISSLFDDEDKRYISSQNFYKIQSILSKSEQNYAISICFRKTYVGTGNSFYSIVEPKIKSNDGYSISFCQKKRPYRKPTWSCPSKKVHEFSLKNNRIFKNFSKITVGKTIMLCCLIGIFYFNRQRK